MSLRRALGDWARGRQSPARVDGLVSRSPVGACGSAAPSPSARGGVGIRVGCGWMTGLPCVGSFTSCARGCELADVHTERVGRRGVTAWRRLRDWAEAGHECRTGRRCAGFCSSCAPGPSGTTCPRDGASTGSPPSPGPWVGRVTGPTPCSQTAATRTASTGAYCGSAESARSSPDEASHTALAWTSSGMSSEEPSLGYGFRHLHTRWERRVHIHESFLGLATCLIIYKHVCSFVWTSYRATGCGTVMVLPTGPAGQEPSGRAAPPRAGEDAATGGCGGRAPSCHEGGGPPRRLRDAGDRLHPRRERAKLLYSNRTGGPPVVPGGPALGRLKGRSSVFRNRMDCA